MNSRSLILSLLMASTCSFHVASEAILTDILEALSDDYTQSGVQEGENTYDASWEYANLLSAINETPESQAAGLARYWSGSTAFVTSEDKISDIQKAQMFIDLIVAKPQVAFSELGGLDSTSQAMVAGNVTGSSDISSESVNGQIIKAWKAMLASNAEGNASQKLMEIYYRLYVLEKKALNCISYWDGGSITSSPPPYVLAPNSADANIYLNTEAPECNKASCSVTRSQFDFNNKSTTIAEEAEKIYDNITALSCKDLNDGTQKNLCNRIQSDGEDILKDANDDLSKATIDGLSNISALTQTTQAILLLRFNNALNAQPKQDEGEGQISFSSIYSPQPIPVPKDGGPTPEGKALYQKTVQTETPRLNALVDSLAGLQGIASPIRPGLPVLDQSTITTPYIMVAGEYYQFEADGSGLYRSKERKNGMYIWTSPDTISDAQKMRSDMRSNYYMKRGGVQGAAAQSLLAKSAAADILNEVKALNTNVHKYANGTQQTGMQTLKHSSNWRLKAEKIGDNNAWLTSVSSMSNVSLLRETAVLLAEMKQLMYMQLSNQQRSLLIQALTASSGTPEAALDTIELEAAIENYASGSGLSSKTPPSPPSADDINDQVRRAQEQN